MGDSMLEVQAHIAEGARRDALMRDVRIGLTAAAKSIPPTWFYDEVGSELFEDITRVPEYYPTARNDRYCRASR